MGLGDQRNADCGCVLILTLSGVPASFPITSQMTYMKGGRGRLCSAGWFRRRGRRHHLTRNLVDDLELESACGGSSAAKLSRQVACQTKTALESWVVETVLFCSLRAAHHGSLLFLHGKMRHIRLVDSLKGRKGAFRSLWVVDSGTSHVHEDNERMRCVCTYWLMVQAVVDTRLLTSANIR